MQRNLSEKSTTTFKVMLFLSLNLNIDYRIHRGTLKTSSQYSFPFSISDIDDFGRHWQAKVNPFSCSFFNKPGNLLDVNSLVPSDTFNMQQPH
jgi:hypothetical protein